MGVAASTPCGNFFAGYSSKAWLLFVRLVTAFLENHPRIQKYWRWVLSKIACQPLDVILSSYCQDLLLIKRRLYLLREINARLLRHVDKSGKIKIKNMTVYDGVRDIYAMLVIDLCSFCKHFGQDGGFIMRLNNHLSLLKPANPKKIDVPDAVIIGGGVSPEHDAEIRKYSRISRREQISHSTVDALKRLFPGWSLGQKITQEHVFDLRSRFKEAVKSIEDDRHIHHAHRFENDSRKLARVVAPLTLAEIENAFGVVEGLLSDLWMIVDTANYNFDTDLNAATGCTARDLVDLIVCGSIGSTVEMAGVSSQLKRMNSPRIWYWQFRDQVESGTVLGLNVTEAENSDD